MDVAGRTLVIRADAGPDIGFGHVMRSLALGQAWKDAGGSVDFVTTNPSEGLITRLENEAFFVHILSQSHPALGDWKGTQRAVEASEKPWMMLDGYHFDTSYQKGVRAAGASLLVIDDNAHLDRYEADLLLNQNAHADDLAYHVPRETRLLLGLRYVLLRREFQPATRPQTEAPENVQKVLFTFGGADPLHLAPMVVPIMDRLDRPDLEATILATQATSATPGLRAAIEGSSRTIHLETDTHQVTTWMEWADLAVSAGGSTVWELAFMGVPSLVIPTSPAEESMERGLGKLGLFAPWPGGQEVSPSTLASKLELLLEDAAWRREMTVRGQDLVDGNGRERVIEAMVGRKA